VHCKADIYGNTPLARVIGFCRCLSFQFGLASAPMAPHIVQTVRGPKVGTGTSYFRAVQVERLVEPFQCDAPNILQVQRFARAQLRNRVGD
jgi:hypothetical protein